MRRRGQRMVAAVLAVLWSAVVGAFPAGADSGVTGRRLAGAGVSATGVNDTGVVAGAVRGSDGANHAALWESSGTVRDLNGDFARDVDGGSDMSGAWGVNGAGQVAAWSRTYADSPVNGWRAVTWSNGRATAIVAPDGAGVAWAVNDRGQVAGAYRDPDDGEHGRPFLWERGTFSTLGDGYGQALALNNRGDAAGWIEVTGQDGVLTHHAAVWHRGALTDLGVPDGFDSSRAVGINDRGLVAGTASTGGKTVAFVWDDGQTRQLSVTCPTVDGQASQAQAQAVNTAGQVAGTCRAGNDSTGFVWADGTTTLLPPLDGDTDSAAHALNNVGVVVGTSMGSGQGHAAAWTLKQRP